MTVARELVHRLQLHVVKNVDTDALEIEFRDEHGARLDPANADVQTFLSSVFEPSASSVTQVAGGSVKIGLGAVATTATAGFLYIGTCAGTPTGTPATVTGFLPLVIDTTNDLLYVYTGDSWDTFAPATGSTEYQATLESITEDSDDNVTVGAGAVATTATDGFLYVPTCAGTPTGTPTAKTGFCPIVVDSTNHELYFYSGGAWVSTTDTGI